MGNKKLYKLKSGCWSLREVKGTGFGNTELFLEEKGRIYEILARDCRLPDDDGNRENDTIIMDICNGDIFYVKGEYLVSISYPHCDVKYCSCCGRKL